MSRLLEEINKANSIGICGHIRPDGDCLGSVTAMYNYIKDNYSDKNVKAFLESIPEKFTYLKRSDEIITSFEEDMEFDLFIVLDSGDIDRIGPATKYFENAKYTFVIDHHISNNGYGDENVVLPKASSTCEVIFELLDYECISYDTAVSLYTGLIHDTGVFKHSNVSAKTFEVAGKLIEKDIPFSKIIDESFYAKTYTQNQILGRCLLESMMCLDGRCIVSCLSRKQLAFYGATSADLDGIIDQLRITRGAEVAIFIYEIGEQEYKVSLRSNNNVDVNKIASYFGGGGHIKASGCTMSGAVHDVINNLTEHIEKQLLVGENNND